jgi:hypothetical protein
MADVPNKHGSLEYMRFKFSCIKHLETQFFIFFQSPENLDIHVSKRSIIFVINFDLLNTNFVTWKMGHKTTGGL